MYSKVVIFKGAKCEISKYFKLLQSKNIKHICVTFEVSNIDKFRVIKELQWANIEYIISTLDVLNVSGNSKDFNE